MKCKDYNRETANSAPNNKILTKIPKIQSRVSQTLSGKTTIQMTHLIANNSAKRGWIGMKWKRKPKEKINKEFEDKYKKKKKENIKREENDDIIKVN